MRSSERVELVELRRENARRELVHRYRFPDRATARRAIFTWINRYNQLRLHSSLGFLPPSEWENQ